MIIKMATAAPGEEETTSSRPPKFSGKQEHYQIFNTRYKAYSRMRGCSGAIDVSGPDPKLPTTGPVAPPLVVYTKDELAESRTTTRQCTTIHCHFRPKDAWA